MGSYFSLHDSAFWEQTIQEAPEPSIWSNVHFSPLALHQRVLLERPGRVKYSHASGLRQGGISVQISNDAQCSLLVGFEEAAGRLYSAILLKAPESSPHRYGRAMEEVTLTHPAARAAAQPMGEPDSPGSSGFGTRSPQSTTRRSVGRQNNSSQRLEIEKLNVDDEPMQETTWPYLLVHTVKEGIILFFTTDYNECVEVIREVALMVGQKAHHFQDMPPRGTKQASGGLARSGTEAAANLAAQMKVKCVERPVGKAPHSTTLLLTETIMSDLRREFRVKCDADEQHDHTNCVVFCLRCLNALQLAVRGYDLRQVCESPENRGCLGRKAGEAACEAWEHLHKRVRN